MAQPSILPEAKCAGCGVHHSNGTCFGPTNARTGLVGKRLHPDRGKAREDMETVQSKTLPDGVALMPLKSHVDDRGDLTEVFRNEWHNSPLPAEWVVSRAQANALRGVHVRRHSWAYACAIAGEVVVGLHDLRPHSSTIRSVMLRLSSAPPHLLVVPSGVAYGFYSPQPSTLILGTSECLDSSDHLACRWDSPELNLNWPCAAPELSAEDRAADGYAAARTTILADRRVDPSS